MSPSLQRSRALPYPQGLGGKHQLLRLVNHDQREPRLQHSQGKRWTFESIDDLKVGARNAKDSAQHDPRHSNPRARCDDDVGPFRAQKSPGYPEISEQIEKVSVGGVVSPNDPLPIETSTSFRRTKTDPCSLTVVPCVSHPQQMREVATRRTDKSELQRAGLGIVLQPDARSQPFWFKPAGRLGSLGRNLSAFNARPPNDLQTSRLSCYKKQ